jgi:hypothetical protein
MIEYIFGWGKPHGTMRKTKHRGIGRVAADSIINIEFQQPVGGFVPFAGIAFSVQTYK